ncbi:MAG: epoxyqueuosine reductase [Deltaproteobacteria bacterium HGW-Deltaproteobacteria-19]|jgi:epoxyqueuosine reductase QueG|nr:MAG: epoxyqueuosine reductase [Deltaproteobacteria bacterium HGW-Deltaproteobacteria-19]
MDDIRSQLKIALYRKGASLLGFADLRNLPPDCRKSLPIGLSIAVALDPMVVTGIETGPTPSYFEEYGRINRLLAELGRAAADILADRGWKAVPAEPTREVFSPDFRTPLPHKTVATRAGLGWIGRNALLITEPYGSAVRLMTVLTDAPFTVSPPVETSRCGTCRLCVDACPGRAPRGEEWGVGKDRDDILDVHACYGTARSLSGRAGIAATTICGICIACCPWTRRYLRQSLRPGRSG